MNNEESKELSTAFFHVSVYILVLGVLFSLGETWSLLSYTYLNTFSYVDFLIKSVLILPFVFFIAIILQFVEQFIEWPINALAEVKKATSIKTETKKNKLLILLNAFSGLYLALLFPIFPVIFFVYPKNYYIPAGLLLFVGFIFVLIKSKTTEYSVKEEARPVFSTKDSVKNLFNQSNKMLLIAFFAFMAGFAYIDIQDTDAPNAILTLKNSKKEIEVKILTSNSNVLAISRENHLEIIPRSEVEVIKFKQILKN